ncbi:MAG: nitrile hydratase subunit beta, partial [Alphaproteobacteria bacterium]|nr:nitrile hydratase subunit beta [Alphaproteobacteria bacterium]
ERVRARNMHPRHHTRIPRYVRGKTGTVVSDRGVFTLPDSHAQNAGHSPQHVYAVGFAACELWGEDAPARDSVVIDLWEDYLEAP